MQVFRRAGYPLAIHHAPYDRLGTSRGFHAGGVRTLAPGALWSAAPCLLFAQVRASHRPRPAVFDASRKRWELLPTSDHPALRNCRYTRYLCAKLVRNSLPGMRTGLPAYCFSRRGILQPRSSRSSPRSLARFQLMRFFCCGVLLTARCSWLAATWRFGCIEYARASAYRFCVLPPALAPQFSAR